MKKGQRRPQRGDRTQFKFEEGVELKLRDEIFRHGNQHDQGHGSRALDESFWSQQAD